VKLLVLDIDGTLTPGDIYYGPTGEDFKRFHTHDGRGIAMVLSTGIHVAIITQESTDFTKARAAKLGISEVHTGVLNKVASLGSICERYSVSLSEVAYVGDDLGDLDVMNHVSSGGGITCAVADARPEVLSVAQFTSRLGGGRGGVRDICDQIMQSHPDL
jgi:YrbI family 3-deoxy-D-manno-octulosonate 8-phosphate phosphatase